MRPARTVAAVVAEVLVRLRPFAWATAWALVLLWHAWGVADPVLYLLEKFARTS